MTTSRFSLIALSLAATTALLAACSSPADEAADSSAPSEPAQETTSSAAATSEEDTAATTSPNTIEATPTVQKNYHQWAHLIPRINSNGLRQAPIWCQSGSVSLTTGHLPASYWTMKALVQLAGLLR